MNFAAKLHLHYSSSQSNHEGLIFTIESNGETLTDSPNPPIHELFYAAVLEGFKVYGYGHGWEGKLISTPGQFTVNLEVTAQTLKEMEIENFYRMLEA